MKSNSTKYQSTITTQTGVAIAATIISTTTTTTPSGYTFLHIIQIIYTFFLKEERHWIHEKH
ncbi:hypothetical protein [Flavobacterium johnsoniae]|uniref:Uncharacterized protein n=1 Tax=Flavobacterium johnsoniae TaxID=986 RepID=A0A1J7CJ50_FLAJO|nr:hypothetical protein [Flavobacterium johnsoniae]OIV41604.1 hypothetical protein BKM63_13830 [Flavobacterium johnsoniae]